MHIAAFRPLANNKSGVANPSGSLSITGTHPIDQLPSLGPRSGEGQLCGYCRRWGSCSGRVLGQRRHSLYADWGHQYLERKRPLLDNLNSSSQPTRLQIFVSSSKVWCPSVERRIPRIGPCRNLPRWKSTLSSKQC